MTQPEETHDIRSTWRSRAAGSASGLVAAMLVVSLPLMIVLAVLLTANGVVQPDHGGAGPERAASPGRWRCTWRTG